VSLRSLTAKNSIYFRALLGFSRQSNLRAFNPADVKVKI